MRLDQVMHSDPVIIDPADKIVDAAQAMRSGRTSAALVVKGGRLVGIISERDLARKIVAEGLSPDGVLVGDVMTPDPITAAPDTSAWEALGKMTVRGIRHLPVVEDGRPAGIVSLRDLASVGADGGRIHTLLADLDEPARARLAEILLWVVDRVGLRREDFSTLMPLDE